MKSISQRKIWNRDTLWKKIKEFKGFKEDEIKKAVFKKKLKKKHFKMMKNYWKDRKVRK